jgi:hypothetical protein
MVYNGVGFNPNEEKSLPVSFLTPEYCMLSGEAANSNLTVFG